MKENEYDNQVFFEKYCQMDRSLKGLAGAGEWYELKKLMPNLANKEVLDLGCGFGWHCKYAVENGAKRVVGIDLSQNMLTKAKQINHSPRINYQKIGIEDYEYPKESFDVVISSLALHYVDCFNEVCQNVFYTLKNHGHFIFSIEHPIFTANGLQEWEYDENQNRKCWPIDQYFEEREITSHFLGEEVIKYHKTLTTLINTLIDHGFKIKRVIEPKPNQKMLATIPEMKEELRRPMMLLISSEK